MLNKAKWLVGSLLVVALLWGARSIVQTNEAAVGGAGQPAGFYGH
jgi:hypothetical protein